MIRAVSMVILPVLGQLGAPDLSICDAPRPTCAHYAVLRSSEVLGVPATMEEIANYLPLALPDIEDGISLLSIKTTLTHLGLAAEGFRVEKRDELIQMRPPLVAFIAAEQPHFVTIIGMDAEGVSYFDCFGNAKKEDWDEFWNEFAGSVLRVWGDDGGGPIGGFFEAIGPRIQFRTLSKDLGTIDRDAGAVRYSFSLYNRGTEALEITGIKTDCSCLRYTIEKTTLQPDERSTIAFDMDVRTKAGGFVENVFVASTDPQHPIIQLSMSGWADTNEVQISPPSLRVAFRPGSQARRRVFVRSIASSDFDVTDVTCTVAGAMAKATRLTEAEIRRRWPGVNDLRLAGATYMVDVEFAAPTTDWSHPVDGKLVITTRTKQEFAVPVTLINDGS